jgi:2-polyprenyl-6-methoxyphenol hydroxylase-like FAD-dependent oxidoreductase
VLIACDGVNSAVRRVFYPDEQMVFTGINTWRGVTRFDPILTGKSYMRIGSIETGKMVIYPIVDKVDAQGRQLVNWMAEIRMEEGVTQNDWNRAGRAEDVLKIFQDWKFDWLDVPQLIAQADAILEYPMVDKDPVDQWTFGRVTLLGDAAHPMYPRGSNGSAQALIDARTLADAGLLALIACLGLAVPLHETSPMLVQLGGSSALFLGVAWLRNKPWRGCLTSVLGLAVLIGGGALHWTLAARQTRMSRPQVPQ